jgi:hypothetical protein
MFRRVFALVGPLALVSLLPRCSGRSVDAQDEKEAVIGAGRGFTPIPAAYFGIDFSHPGTEPFPNALLAPGPVTARIWDVSYPPGALSWSAINQCPSGGCAADPTRSTFDWSNLDHFLKDLSDNGYEDALYVLSRTPDWASQRGSRCGVSTGDPTCSGPPDDWCDYHDNGDKFGGGPGQCETNVDLKPDGTGTNATWRRWVTELVTHVKSLPAGYAPIRYYEIWNEPYRSDTLWQDPQCDSKHSCSFRGTWAQLLRMAEDARCIIQGRASDPVTALGKTCATDRTLPAVGLDPAAKIVSPSGGARLVHRAFLQNFLYCDAEDKYAPPPASHCTWTRADPRGSNVVDVINTHNYFENGDLPETSAAAMAGEQSYLSDTDAKKPFFNDEGSGDWHDTPYDPDIEEATVPRWFLTLRSQGSARSTWYDANAPLFVEKGRGGCTDDKGCVTKGGVGLERSITWLVGKSLRSACTTAGTIWQCELVSGDPTYRGLVVWDIGACTNDAGCDSKTKLTGCNFATDCRTSSFSLPSLAGGGWTSWRDLDTDTPHPIAGNAVPIGVKPVLVERVVTN